MSCTWSLLLMLWCWLQVSLVSLTFFHKESRLLLLTLFCFAGLLCFMGRLSCSGAPGWWWISLPVNKPCWQCPASTHRDDGRRTTAELHYGWLQERKNEQLSQKVSFLMWFWGMGPFRSDKMVGGISAGQSHPNQSVRKGAGEKRTSPGRLPPSRIVVL